MYERAFKKYKRQRAMSTTLRKGSLPVQFMSKSPFQKIIDKEKKYRYFLRLHPLVPFTLCKSCKEKSKYNGPFCSIQDKKPFNAWVIFV